VNQPASVEDGAELARGAVVNTLAMLASNFRGVFTFLVARLLGRATLGTFTVAWAITDLLSKLGVAGLDQGVTTFIARSEAAGDRSYSRTLYRSALGLSLTLSVVFAALCCAVAYVFGTALGQPREVMVALIIVVWAMPGLALYKVGNGGSRGMRVMRHDFYSRGVTEPVATTAAFLIAMAFGARQSAPEIAAIAGTLACGIVAAALAAALFREPGPKPTPGPEPVGTTRALVAFSAPIAGYDLLNTLILSLDIVMLGFFVNKAPGVTLATVGVYAAAVDVASGLRKVSQLFNPIFAPVVAAMAAGRDDSRAATTYGHLARWTLAILFPLVAIMTLGGNAILAIYGPGFREGALWLSIIAVACAANAFVSLGEVAIMVQRPHMNLFNSTATCLVAVGANLWLIPAFGMTGAALGILLPYVIQGVLRYAELRFIFRWPSQAREMTRPIVAAAAAAVPSVALRAVAPSILGQLASVAVFLAAYVAAWRVLGLEPADRAIVQELTGRTV
jgi:O-antigen/teichoic acid export membrane protein